MTKRHATVFIIIDGGRHDYIKRENMPFLHGLTRTGITAALRPTPGGDPQTAFFMGRDDAPRRLTPHAFDPANSPYRWMNDDGPLRLLNRPRRGNAATRAAIRRLTRLVVDAEADPAYIPPVQLPYFRPDAQPENSDHGIFALLAKHGRSHLRITAPDDAATEDALVREIRNGPPQDLFVAEFTDLEQAGRKKGPLRDRAPELGTLDERLARVHAALAGSYESWDLFVCGDHGMAPVRHRINALEVLATADAEPGMDYVAYVTSTWLMVWHLTERGEKALDRVLPRIPGSELVGAEDRKRLGLTTGPHAGDRIVAAKPGVIFWPDFERPPTTRLRGVHGGLHPQEEGDALAVLVSSARRSRPVSAGARTAADVYATLCELVDLPSSRDRQRRSLLQAERRTLVIGG